LKRLGEPEGRPKLEASDTGTSGRSKTAFQGVLCGKSERHVALKRNIARRLERLIAREMPKAPRVLKILVTRIGGPNRTIELVLNEGRYVE
jgi:hypothetical protein